MNIIFICLCIPLQGEMGDKGMIGEQGPPGAPDSESRPEPVSIKPL